MSAEDYSHLACPNPDCSAYGQRGAANLRLHGWSGRAKRIRCLHCSTCGTDFSGRANTPLFGLRTSEDTLVAIARHLGEGVGCRATAPPGRATPPLFGLRTSEDPLVAIARHLGEGVGCRATARLTGVTLNTVLRFTARFGKHAELFHDSMVRGIQPKQIQADEAWSFVGKKG